MRNKTKKKTAFGKKKTLKRRKTLKQRNNSCETSSIIGLKTFEHKLKPYNPIQEKHKLLKQLLSNFNPSNTNPKNDFYTYINYDWLQNVSISEQQKYLVQVDDFRLTQHNVYEELQTILSNYINDHKNKHNSFAQNMGHFYHSILHMNSKSSTKQLAKEAENIITTFFQKNNPWDLLAYINADEMTAFMAPFVWNVDTNAYNSKKNCSYLVSHSFIILDLDVYENNHFDNHATKIYKQKYRQAFHKMCQTLFVTLLGPNHGYNTKDVYQVETEIYEALGCYKIKESEFDLSLVGSKEALDTYGFDWAEFTKCLGYKTTPPSFIVSSLNYLKCGTQLFLKNWNSKHWKTYWVYILLSRLARITKDWETINYNFFGEFERGQEQINRSDAVSASLYMSLPYNTFMTEQYVKHYTNPQIIEYAKTLCMDLKLVFRNMLKHNTWLQPATKKYAIKKLDHFKFVFGRYDTLRADPHLTYGTNLYDNLKKILQWRLHKFIEMDGKEPINVPLMDWSNYPVKMAGDQAYIVNASYTPGKNAIYINAGYLQPPFVDLNERGIEYNLAHLGFTIAHEMSHGFDDMGSQFGYDGNLHDWWTPEDKQVYKRMQKDVIQQYEEFARRDGIDFDASIGIGEDLADIGGLSICDNYLRDFQNKNDDLLPIKRIGFEAFYIYFAFQQRQLIHKKALRAQLKTNPHPLDKYRCNVPLSRSTLFRGLYNVKKNNGMWWHNTNMIW